MDWEATRAVLEEVKREAARMGEEVASIRDEVGTLLRERDELRENLERCRSYLSQERENNNDACRLMKAHRLRFEDAELEAARLRVELTTATLERDELRGCAWATLCDTLQAQRNEARAVARHLQDVVDRQAAMLALRAPVQLQAGPSTSEQRQADRAGYAWLVGKPTGDAG